MTLGSTKSVLFNGSSQYATAGNVLGFDYNTPFTYVAWFKTSSGAQQTIMSKLNSSGVTNGQLLKLNNAGNLLFFQIGNHGVGDTNWFQTDESFNDGLWHHVVATFNGTSVAVYVDGRLQPGTLTGTLSGATSLNSVDFLVGQLAALTEYFNGSIDDVLVYNVGLLQADVTWLHNGGFGNDPEDVSAPSGLVARWRMGEGATPPTIQDEIGSNDLTLVGSPTIQDVGAGPTYYEASFVPETHADISAPSLFSVSENVSLSFVPEDHVDITAPSTFSLTFGSASDPAPAIGSFSPSPGSTILAADSVSFEVTDDTTPIQQVTVYVLYGSASPELIYDGSALLGPFASASSVTPLGNGLSFSVARAGGWPDASVSLIVIANDEGGNETTATPTAYSVSDAVPPDAASPVIGGFSPAQGSVIEPTQPIYFEVTDDTGQLRRIIVHAVFEDGVEEVVFDGDAFRGYYQVGCSLSIIAGGFSFSILRRGGWPSSPTIRVFAIDAVGNETTA